MKKYVRPQFVERMSQELENNQNKGDWSAWMPTRKELISELSHHYSKLIWALAIDDGNNVAEFSADIANFCMKAHHLYGAQTK